MFYFFQINNTDHKLLNDSVKNNNDKNKEIVFVIVTLCLTILSDLISHNVT